MDSSLDGGAGEGDGAVPPGVHEAADAEGFHSEALMFIVRRCWVVVV